MSDGNAVRGESSCDGFKVGNSDSRGNSYVACYCALRNCAGYSRRFKSNGSGNIFRRRRRRRRGNRV